MQPLPVIRPGYNNQMLRSLRALPQTEGAHPASVDTLLTRIVSFTGELDQELKKLTAQQVIDMIRNKPEIMPPEWAQDLVRKPTPETQLTAFLSLLSQLKQQSLNPYTPLNPFYKQPLNNRFIPPLNPFLPTMNPPQTQISEPLIHEYQNRTQPVQQMDQATTQTVERPRPNSATTRSISNLLIPPNHNYHRCEKIQQQMKTRHKGVQS
ncbi:MAG: hypothetical protein EZS28_049194 [Streblomastix strix]|uniref:Uncharacterized protein n=1 Tax=Streblomastix strix TaxID=222440 RepID=A0A5J4TAJ3_9EUKA|nr:MAG: hypothetical protein EZS28_049194 [Streblomastix strix]